MANINRELNEIKNAVYGKDVRQAIHDAIEKAYNDATSYGGEKDLEVILARGNYDALNKRLDAADSQLAETELYLDNKKMDKNTNDISVHQINKNKGLIDETYLSEELLQQIAGDTPIHSTPADKSITNIKLANDSVGIENINFTRKTENLFEGYYRGIIDQFESPWIVDMRDASVTEHGVIAIVPVENNSTYHVRKFDDSDRLRIVGTKERPIQGKITQSNTHYGMHNNNSRTIQDTFDNNYLVIFVSYSSERPRISITKDTDYDSFIPSGKIKKEYVEYAPPEADSIEDSMVKNNTLSVNKLSFTKKTENLFEGYVRGFIPTDTNPWSVNRIEKASTENGVIAIVPVENNSKYVITRYDTSDRFRVLGTKIYPEEGKNTPGNTHYGTAEKQMSRTIQDTFDNNYLVILVSKSKEKPRITITKDKAPLEYIPPKVIKKEFVEASDNSVEYSPRLFGDLSSIYRSDKIDGVVSADIRSSTANDIYGEYDELMTEYPDIIDKNLLGYGTKNGGGTDHNLPIYEYVFHNPKDEVFTRPLNDNSPTLLLTTGVHGHEKTTTWGTIYFLRQLLSKWDDTSMTIKNNVTIRLIPVVNPGGFNNDVRRNNNGVDINRNFGYRWDTSTDDFKGTSPYSEEESKIVRDWLVQHSGENTIFIDYHNTREKIGTSYLITDTLPVARSYESLIRVMSGYWNHKYKGIASKNTFGWVENNREPMIVNEARHVNNIKLSSVLETTWDYNGVRHTNETMEMAVDLLCNHIINMLKIYNESSIQ